MCVWVRNKEVEKINFTMGIVEKWEFSIDKLLYQFVNSIVTKEISYNRLNYAPFTYMNNGHGILNKPCQPCDVTYIG